MREILIYNPITWLYLFFVLALAVAVLWPGRHDPPARPESGGRGRPESSLGRTAEDSRQPQEELP